MAGENQINEELALAIAKAMAAAGASADQISEAVLNTTKEMSKQDAYWNRQQEEGE